MQREGEQGVAFEVLLGVLKGFAENDRFAAARKMILMLSGFSVLLCALRRHSGFMESWQKGHFDSSQTRLKSSIARFGTYQQHVALHLFAQCIHAVMSEHSDLCTGRKIVSVNFLRMIDRFIERSIRCQHPSSIF
jgi:hypothetical protein